jgi:hypothetical protein
VQGAAKHLRERHWLRQLLADMRHWRVLTKMDSLRFWVTEDAGVDGYRFDWPLYRRGDHGFIGAPAPFPPP